jgi:hypothetical protein
MLPTPFAANFSLLVNGTAWCATKNNICAAVIEGCNRLFAAHKKWNNRNAK